MSEKSDLYLQKASQQCTDQLCEKESLETLPPQEQEVARVLHQFAIHVQTDLEHILKPHIKRVIVLSGPTAVGKTRLSLELAERLNGEIVSADAIQVYQKMNIGTAKVTEAEQRRIPHYMIDVCDVTYPYNVKEFFDNARLAILSILDRGKVPIVVGGTGFYIHSLIYGPPSGPPSEPSIRAQLELDEEKFGIEYLYDKLRNFDPVYAATIMPSDRHKVLRGLEIIEISGKKVSDFSWRVRNPEGQFDFRLWFLYMPRPILYKRLEARCDEMLRNGLLEEVIELDRCGIRKNRAAAQAIGYKETLAYLDTVKAKSDYDAFVEKFKAASRHLVKRQFTWFRKEPHFRWVDITTIEEQALLDWICEDYYSALPYEYGLSEDLST